MEPHLFQSIKRPPYGGELLASNMDLRGATWMVRSLGESVSMVHVMENGDVFAGGWDGHLIRWDEEGNVRWTAQTGNRISALAVNEQAVVVTSGLHLVALDPGTGEQRWKVALEGSADDVRWWNDALLAVSSVYDIEHNDFIESALWKFDVDGECLWVERMDERPWSVLELGDECYAGLGRPRCGWLTLSDEPPFEHHLPPTSYPVMSGVSGRERLLFGQTDGSVVDHKSTVLSTESGAVEHLNLLSQGFAASTDEGHLAVRSDEGKLRWESKGDPITAQHRGLIADETNLFWVARASEVTGQLSVYDSGDGSILASTALSRVRSISSTETRTAVGCDDGEVLVWDSTLLARRLNQESTSNDEPVSDRKAALQAKLLALRQSK